MTWDEGCDALLVLALFLLAGLAGAGLAAL